MILPDDATPKPDEIFGKDTYFFVLSYPRRLGLLAQQAVGELFTAGLVPFG